MKLSALPAVSLSICSAIHPSSDLSTSGGGRGGGGAASHLKLLGQLSRDVSLHPGSGERRLSACCTRCSPETLSGSRCSAPDALGDAHICRETPIPVPGSRALTRQDVVFHRFPPVSTTWPLLASGQKRQIVAKTKTGILLANESHYQNSSGIMHGDPERSCLNLG